MNATPPPPEAAEEGPVPDKPTISREKVLLGIPSRAKIALPGVGSGFGRGFLRRLNALGTSALVYMLLLVLGMAVVVFGLVGNKEGPYKIAAACGAVFFLLVLRAFQVDLNRKRDRRPSQPRRKEDRRAPWTYDYPWSTTWMAPEGEDVDSSLLGSVTFFAVVALCNTLWLVGETFFYVFLTFLDLLALYFLWRLLRKGVQSVRFRKPVVIWEEIPVYPGNPIKGKIAFPRDVRATGPTRLTLRCMVEKWKGGGLDSDVFAVYRETYEVPLPGEPGEPLDVLSFSFQVPRDRPGTALLKDEPVYWHLVVNVPVAGPDLEVAFLAPVYQKR